IPDLVDSFRPTEAVLQSIAMCRIDTVRQADRIACPTLGIVGGWSKTAVTLMERAIGPIPGAKLVVIPDAIDPSNLCQPEAFNRLLGAFLAELGMPGTRDDLPPASPADQASKGAIGDP